MKRLILITLICPILSLAQTPFIIPRPASLEMKTGTFTISANTYFLAMGSGMENSIDFLNNYLQTYYGFQLKKETKPGLLNVILLNYERMDNSIPGAYSLDVTKDNISINADNEQGLFYGIQTLIQLLPTEKKNSLSIPQLSIVDSPRFAYRGMHLDVSRHFFPVNYIKKYIDYIALHKMNYFHWHLTDDHGWRIEIKKYPRLTSVGAWRNGTIIGRYPGTGNDHIRYGGFYTQEQVKEIVEYAAKRYITVIPEIEMPGHSLGALAAYPQLGTTPDSNYEVAQTWGIFGKFNNVLSPTEYTFNFLQDVLDEVMKLFPSPYIHIGGDECSKQWWHASAFCQKLMKDKGMKDENGLQSYFIQRIEKYVNSKGKKIIGWDEILEGGLAPNAAVMSWRGEAGGIAAAKQHHNVVMTPEDPLYFNHSQSRNEDSLTAGSYTPLENVYKYEPVAKGLNLKDGKYVIGAQGNVWTEYIGNMAKIEYMIFPRMSALSEVLWSPKEKRDWPDFEKRLSAQFKRYELWKCNYSTAYFDLNATVMPSGNNKGLQVSFASKLANPVITMYKLVKHDSTALGEYKNPVTINEETRLYADLISDGRLIRRYDQLFRYNLATGKSITLAKPPADKYKGDGAFTLVNGIVNEKGFSKQTEFLGFQGTDCEAVIDLGESQLISFVVVNALDRPASWIYRPLTAEVLGSSDGNNYYSLKLTDDFTPGSNEKGTMTMSFKATYARFLKVIIKNWGIIPAGQPGGGMPAWLLVDEIEVYGPDKG